MQDLYQEVDALMTKIGVGMHKIKPCSRKYAFELPDVPKEADYLKLMYPYNSKYSVPVVILANFNKSLHFQSITKGRPTPTSLAQIQLYSSSLCYGRISWDRAG
jgi:hypothetical protein